MSRLKPSCRAAAFILAILLLYYPGAAAQTGNTGDAAPLTARERAMLERIDSLEKRLTALEAKTAASLQPAPGAALSTPAPAPASNVQTEEGVRAGALGLPGMSLSFYLDGYYGWNFSRPVGRVNLLRANDVLANSFTINQASLILERAPNVSAGRRYGARLDLMFGQNTETLQGSAQNEPRPQVYRNIFQAYGTYVFPVGKGLTLDFGKFASGLGFENNYAYHELNYSRSFFFNFLPFYHMGFRTTYNVNDKFTLQHWYVNGANQTEDFNEDISNGFVFSFRPAKSVTWNVNYYFGKEGRDLTPELNPGLPTLPTQPGLSTTPAPARLNGRTHIFDTYASWSPGKFTVAGEFDHVLSRLVATGAPSTVTGGVGYLQYRFTPRFSLASRFEYLRDHEGLFSGVSEDLKENTVTAAYQFAEGFQVRLEQRRDFSNQPLFLTSNPGLRKKEQNTAMLGLIWWFGGKREPW